MSPCPYARRPHRPGGRPRSPIHASHTAQGRLAGALDDALCGWSNTEVAAYATAAGLPLSAATVGRARSGRCVPSIETVRALAAVAGVDPAELLALRTAVVWGPYAPVDQPGATRYVVVASLGASLEALRRRGARPLPYRTLARRAGMAETTVRSRLTGVWPAGGWCEGDLLGQLDRLLHALGVPSTASDLWYAPIQRALSRSTLSRFRLGRSWKWRQ